MADIIKLLPDHVANQIAAGEVVQRPASVVKELLENAIDAGGTTIKLIVKDGGKSLVQVVDDGMGMTDTDARLSFERHATSKIRKAEDLFSLHTKGFRGEALASIAAIAHVEMKTRPEDREIGTHIKIEGSKIIFQEADASPLGTSIAVKNLFFNIPARRNFLKSDQVELRHIIDEFQRVALAHPDIAFHMYHNGSETFRLPKTHFRLRIANIFGDKINSKLVPVEEKTKVVHVSGLVTRPEFAKKSRGEQFFFVNDRFIKSPYLHHAVVSAFEGLVRADSHPGYFLNLKVDPASIDINIHPTKTEVKFDDEHTLYALLRSAVKHSLGQYNIMPALDFESDQNLMTPYAFKDREASLPKVTVDNDFNPFKEERPHAPSRWAGPKRDAGAWESIYVGIKESVVGKEEPFGNVHFESDTITGSIFETVAENLESAATTFQLRRKYIVTTIKSGMVVIDQSRAHQRVLYERFLRNATVLGTASQQLLFPLSLSFSRSHVALLKEMRESLMTIGFQFEVLDDYVQLTGLPVLVNEGEAGMVLDQLVADFQMEVPGDSFSQTDRISKTLAKALCVKTGEALESTSQLALVNDLFACTESRVSPFNKPIYITISEDEIDRKFI